MKQGWSEGGLLRPVTWAVGGTEWRKAFVGLSEKLQIGILAGELAGTKK